MEFIAARELKSRIFDETLTLDNVRNRERGVRDERSVSRLCRTQASVGDVGTILGSTGPRTPNPLSPSP
jgi:hypothetical protein